MALDPPEADHLSLTSISVKPELGDQIMGGEDRKQKTSEVLLQFRALGYVAACALIGVAAWHLWSRSVRSTIVIEAGPKGGFFEETAILLKNELRRYHIGSVIVYRNETLKIIEDVNDSKSPVQVGFMAEDTGNRKYPGVTGAGTIALELFVDLLFGITGLQERARSQRHEVDCGPSGRRRQSNVGAHPWRVRDRPAKHDVPPDSRE